MTTVDARCAIKFALGFWFLKGTQCVPLCRETLEVNFDPWSLISDLSRYKLSNQICSGAFRSRKGHSVSLFFEKP